jgi:hypothetical protein
MQTETITFQPGDRVRAIVGETVYVVVAQDGRVVTVESADGSFSTAFYASALTRVEEQAEPTPVVPIPADPRAELTSIIATLSRIREEYPTEQPQPELTDQTVTEYLHGIGSNRDVLDLVPESALELHAEDLLSERAFDVDEILNEYGSDTFADELKRRGELPNHDDEVSDLRNLADSLESLGSVDLEDVLDRAADLADEIHSIANALEG